MNASTTTTTKPKATTYTYERDENGPTGRMIANGQVVGTSAYEDVNTYVGNGLAVHAGRRAVLNVTAAFDAYNRFGRAEASYKPGDVIPFESWPVCGSHSTHKTGGYSNGWRGKNRATTEEVTCTKCLKRGN